MQTQAQRVNSVGKDVAEYETTKRSVRAKLLGYAPALSFVKLCSVLLQVSPRRVQASTVGNAEVLEAVPEALRDVREFHAHRVTSINRSEAAVILAAIFIWLAVHIVVLQSRPSLTLSTLEASRPMLASLLVSNSLSLCCKIA